ncbi:MAG: hydrogenase 3 maturation endopeptidase HyCI [Candidatus Omnitrophica bacterium]|nr:hydrogenase 3 maturation endopeptidase HyCI [Candidatus Omnitrophota bacterium]
MPNETFSLRRFRWQLTRKHLVVVGVGNTLKGDDAFGPMLIERLLKANVPIDCFDCGVAPENYLTKIAACRPDVIFIIDTLDFGGAPGELAVFNTEELTEGGISTHGMSLRLFAQFLRACANPDIFFIGVQPKSLFLNEPIQKEVAASLEILEREIKALFTPLDPENPAFPSAQ